MVDDNEDAAEAVRMMRAHQQLYSALADFEASQTKGVNTGVQHDVHVIAWRLKPATAA